MHIALWRYCQRTHSLAEVHLDRGVVLKILVVDEYVAKTSVIPHDLHIFCDGAHLVNDIAQIVRRGSKYGIKLKATAPAMHIMRVDVETEVNPVLNADMQNEENLKAWLEEFGEDGQNFTDVNLVIRKLA